MKPFGDCEMTTSHQTITTTVVEHPTGPEVRLGLRKDGYSLAHLGLIQMAIRHALMPLPSTAPASSSTHDLTQAFLLQQSRIAAPT